jgi:hypothetical protein
MKKMNKKLFILLYILFIMVVPTLAQDGFGDPGDDVPIDGGLTLLAAAGIGYGAKKINQYRKKQ